jgi:cell wall-associated NlpC family hydrolase
VALTILTLSLLTIGVATAPKVHAKIEAVAHGVAASVVADVRAGVDVGVDVAVSRLGSVAAQAGGGGESSKPVKPVSLAGTGRGATIARWAQAQAGKGYQFGATGPSRFDCSGLSLRAAAQVGVRLPRTAAQQFGYGKRISRAQLQPGDLIFWSTKKGISHVAVSLGGNRMVAAANPRKGVVIGTIYGSPAGYRRIA